jgi:hypothetical protein
MTRLLFRFIGIWLLAGAFVALVIDGTRSISASRLVISGFAETAAVVFPGTIEFLRNANEEYLPPWLAELLVAYVLEAPLWAVLGVLGALFVILPRRRARTIGYSSRD